MTLLTKLSGQLDHLRSRRLDDQSSRFQRVFDMSSVGMVWASDDGVILHANQSMADFTGYAIEELERMPYEGLLPPEDRDEYRQVISEELLNGKAPKDRERRYLRKDGELVWGLRSVTLMLSPTGEPSHKFIMIQDITDRKRAQQALFEEERALAVLNKTAEKLNAELDLETLLQVVTDAGVESIGAEFGVLCSRDRTEEGEYCQLHALCGLARDAFKQLPLIRDRAPFEPILAATGVLRWDDIQTDERFRTESESGEPLVRSYLVVPLASRTKEVTGALFFGHSEPNVFTERAERIISGLATHASFAIEKASLFDAAQREIDRRKKVEASLNASEARFRDFAEAGSDLLWETDSEFRITSIVGDTSAVLGLPENAIVGRTRWQIANIDAGQPRWKRHIEDHLAWRPFRNFEHEVIDQSGAKRWISTNGRPYFDQNGSLLGYRGTSTNIAARKHAEAKVAASARQQQSAAVLSQLALQRIPRDELYRVAVELVSRTLDVELAGILELSSDRRVLRLRAGVGWPPQSVNIRAVPVDYCPPLARGVSSDVPVHFSRRNFNLIPGLETANGAGVAVPIGEKTVRTGLLVVCSRGGRAYTESDTNFLRAVSFVLAADAEQRKIEATLKLRDRALEAVGEGIMITDATELDQPVIYVNPAFESITGYAREEAVGHNSRFLQGEHTDPGVIREIRTAIEEETTFRGSVLNYRKDGSSFWSSLTISPIHGDDGKASHFVGILSDETERMQLESQLKQAQKMESLGHLTGGVAHDFNNLLAVILGNTEILCDEIDDPAMKEIAELVMSTAEKGADLTQRLLAFGRRQALHPERLDLGVVIASLTEMLRRTIGDPVTLDTRALAEEYAYVDRNLFESAILNLVLNARDAMPSGGTLTVTTDVVHAKDLPPGLQPGNYVRVSVADTGLGMEKDVLDRAFDPFFTTKNLGKGSGMGLSMVYGFAKQSGGHVTIESEVGQGTTVRLFLPVAEESARPARTESLRNEGPIKGGNETILLVEDEPQLRRFVSTQLSGLGYKVLEAEAGAPALEILREDPKKIDLLFTDVLMPGGMSGFDLVQHAREVVPDLRVLMTTGYAAEADKMIADIQEMILKKPYKKHQLAVAVRSVLEQAA